MRRKVGPKAPNENKEDPLNNKDKPLQQPNVLEVTTLPELREYVDECDRYRAFYSEVLRELKRESAEDSEEIKNFTIVRDLLEVQILKLKAILDQTLPSGQDPNKIVNEAEENITTLINCWACIEEGADINEDELKCFAKNSEDYQNL